MARNYDSVTQMAFEEPRAGGGKYVHEVRVLIDSQALGRYLTARARDSASRVATLAGGAVRLCLDETKVTT